MPFCSKALAHTMKFIELKSFSIVSAARADAVLKFIRVQKHQAWLIGEVVRGRGEAQVV
jgi:hypothetical protein